MTDAAVLDDQAPLPGPDRRARDGEGVFAALDLGTNNCRLLVARPSCDGFRVIDAFSRIVRLGEGLAATGALSEAAMVRTIAALRVCAHKLRARRVDRVRAVATEACRRASNCGVFLDRVRVETGLAIEIISTVEEARLVLRGCAPLLEPGRDRALVFDIGGGSTELVWVDTSRAECPAVLGIASVPYGVVNLADRYGGHAVSAETYGAMREEIAECLAPFEEEHDIRAMAEAGRVQMLGSSGTVTTIAGIHLGLPRYVRAQVDGVTLEAAAAEAVMDRLLALDFAGRAGLPCVGPERADLVLAGCAILAAMLGHWPVPRLRVADRGVREGILYGLMAGAAGAARPGAAA